ncbi:hypothetical protein WA026_004022 [Henosepilachna vigintioctopunctata]
MDEYGKIHPQHELLQIFRDHLPVLPEEFWQTAVASILEYKRIENFDLDASLMQYILCLISWYSDEELSNPDCLINVGFTALLASQFYLRLLNLVEFKYFKGNIYKNTLNALRKYCDGYQRNIYCFNCLKSLRLFLVNKELNKKYLEITLFQLCDIIENTSRRVHTNFSIDSTTDLDHEAFICIRSLATQIWRTKAMFIINYSLLNGIRSESCNDIMKKNFRNLIIDLKPKLKEDNFANFQNVFLFIVAKSKSFDPVEASKLMSSLDEQFFKETIFKLTTMGVSKEVSNKSNILKLFSKLLEHLPTNYYETPKLEIFIQSLLNICVLNCINNDEAISLVSKICLLNKEVINKQFEILLNSPTEYIFVENSLPTFCMKFSMHWTNRIRNRNIVVIILRIMCNTISISSDDQYAGILAMIGNEADPSDMKMSIPLLLNLYITSKKKLLKHVPEKILELMYSMAVHRSTSSSDFIKVLFQQIVEPSEDLSPYKSDFIITLHSYIIEDNKIFINKAYELKLLESYAIKKMISTILRGDYDSLRLTCAVTEKVPDPQGEKLMSYMMANPFLLTKTRYTADLLFIIQCGMKYFLTYQRNTSLTTIQQDNVRQFKALLWNHFLKLSLPFNAVGIGLDVLKTLSELTNEPVDFEIFFQTVNLELKAALLKIPNETYAVPIMFSTELISNEQYDVPRDIIKCLEDALDRITSNQDQNAKMLAYHYFCLVLMSRIAMKHSRLGSKTMNYIKSALKKVDQEFKMAVIDLMYDLCTYVVHNFEEFVQYSFSNLKSPNSTIRKQAAMHIEHFIRLDYLKLSMEQYCKFISLLGDPMIQRNLQNLITNFVLKNQSIVEKYFLALIMHINFYSVHPMCPMNPQYMQDMNCIIRANFNKWKVFSTLFRSLPLRSKFLILKEISVSFFDKFINGKMKIEDGIWNVITDSISLFKIMAYSSLDNVKYEEFYEKGTSEITKFIIDKKSIPSEVALKYPEMKDTIEKTTYSLLHLLFYTENETILQNYKLNLFEAILFWTHDLLPDISAICNTRKDNIPSKIVNYYLKLINFYKKHKQCLNIAEYISEYNEANTFNLS